ncbi:hypothetical protein ABW21_db0205146 [Orbilia brochopaga]|nr:hypothetical protein ABW21_db0205146 [Drechslerella brochopaga]
MPKTHNRWIHTKSCEFSPAGNLSLGQILAEPKDPAFVLQPEGPLPIPEGIKVEDTSRENINLENKKELSSQFSAWTKLSYLPVHFKGSASATKVHNLTWHFDKIESRIISPTITYVEAAMRHGDVQASLREWMFKRRVYMVTGVRIAIGARMMRKDVLETSLSSSAKGGVPDQSLSTGIGGGFANKSTDTEEFGAASDFVFAYRLNEVRYKGKITHKPYRGGEVASISADIPQAPKEDGIEITDFEVLRISGIPLAGNAADFDQYDVPGHEDDLECFVAKDQ